MCYLETDGGRIFYSAEGEKGGETIVLLHGLSADSHMFRPQIDFFKNRYRVIVPDLRGNGRSCTLACRVEDVLAIQARDVIGILEQEGVTSAFIGSTSYGGILTMPLMAEHPKLFRGAILCDTFCFSSGTPIMNRLAQLMAPLVKHAWFMRASTMPIYRRWSQAQNYFDNLFDHIRPEESVLQRRAINSIDYREALRACQIPTLLLAGNYTGKLVKTMEETERRMTICQHHVIANSSDPSNLCQPDIYNRLVDGFLEGVLRCS